MYLFILFVDSYKLYKIFLKNEPNDVKNKICMTLFGIPGVGKSTFLARLLSNLSAEDFYNEIIKRSSDKEMIKVENVDIGRSGTSVTMIPRLYVINEILIYDAPGFKDSDVNKNIVINILHKCLLNHIIKNKFIVVIRLELLNDIRMNNLISDYYRSFQLLFGENYKSCIDNIYFVITHIDQSIINIKDLKEVISERMISAIDLEEQHLAYFIKRLTKFHIIVDYEKDDQEKLVLKLSKMISDDSKGMTQNQVMKTQLDVFENDLDKETTKKFTKIDKNNTIKI